MVRALDIVDALPLANPRRRGQGQQLGEKNGEGIERVAAKGLRGRGCERIAPGDRAGREPADQDRMAPKMVRVRKFVRIKTSPTGSRPMPGKRARLSL